MTELKLTEAKWRAYMGDVPDIDAAIAALDAAGLIADEPEPDTRIRDMAREICARVAEELGRSPISECYRNGTYDPGPEVQHTMEVLRSVMRPVTRERLREAVIEAALDELSDWHFGLVKDQSERQAAESFIDRLHAKLTGVGDD